MTHWQLATSMLRRCGNWSHTFRWRMGNPSCGRHQRLAARRYGTSPGRGYYHSSSRQSAGRSCTDGHRWQTPDLRGWPTTSVPLGPAGPTGPVGPLGPAGPRVQASPRLQHAWATYSGTVRRIRRTRLKPALLRATAEPDPVGRGENATICLAHTYHRHRARLLQRPGKSTS